MFFFTFQSVPKPGTEYAGKYDGAYINCWINSERHEEAEEIARQYIENCGWTVEAREEDRAVDENDYTDARNGLEYFRKAETEGSCFVFHTYPAC